MLNGKILGFLPAFSPHYPFNAECQAEKLWTPPC